MNGSIEGEVADPRDLVYERLRRHCRLYGVRLLGWEDGDCYFLQATFANGQYGLVATGSTQAWAMRQLHWKLLDRFLQDPQMYRPVEQT